MTWTLEQMTGFLKRAGVCLNCGSRDRVVDGECLRCIVERDKHENWPRIQAEYDARKSA